MKTRITRAITGFVFALVLLLTSCQRDKAHQHSSLTDTPPVVMEHKGNEIFQYWELENDPTLFESPDGQRFALQSFRDSLEVALGGEAAQKAIQKEASLNTTFDSLDTENGDRMNAQLVHSGRVGKIRPMNFLEAELLNYQLTRYPLLSHPTEFHGFILRNDSLNHLRVYFAASDQPWPPKPAIIMESIKQDLKKGWTLDYHLHNHYEPKSNNYVGILAPSMADAQFFVFLSQDYGLKNALITNGFHTLEIESKDFSRFRMHGDQ